MKQGLLAFILVLLSVASAAAQVPTHSVATEPVTSPPRSEMPLAPGATPALEPAMQAAPGDDVLNKYYARCMQSIYTDLSTDAREEFCACSAAQMKDTMTAGEMTTLSDGKGGEPVDLKKLAIGVVAPCFAPVAQEMEYNRCESDGEYVHMYKTREAFDATCRCIGGRAGDYVQSYGRDLMAYTLALNPGRAADPSEALRNAPEYRQEVAKALSPCMNKNVYH